MAYIYDLSDQWTAAGTTFTGIKLSVTDTASAAGSLLMDLQVGGVSRFSVRKDGNAKFGAGATLFEILPDSYLAYFKTGTATPLTLGDTWISIGSSSLDVRLYRDAANTLAQRNGVNAQAFNLYNTYTDASNYERGFMRWTSGRFEIGADALGGGTDRVTTLFNRCKTGVYNANAAIRLEVDAGVFQKSLSFKYSGGIHFQWGIDGTSIGHFSSQGISSGTADFGGGGSALGLDAGFRRIAANVTGVIVRPSGSDVGGAIEFLENTAPAAPVADRVRIYAEDNGSGKTRLMALFATGAAVQIAIEP